jgi:hypothetical protein
MGFSHPKRRYNESRPDECISDQKNAVVICAEVANVRPVTDKPTPVPNILSFLFSKT